jgi:hypothetical protein
LVLIERNTGTGKSYPASAWCDGSRV